MAQFVFYEWSCADTYKVSAKSGLILREEQSLESNSITLIPFQSKVKVCDENAKEETIDGLKGKWVKTFWEEKEGYVFDEYLEKVENNPIFNLYNAEKDLINTWQNTLFSNEKDYYGLFRTTNPQEYVLRKIELTKEENTDFRKPSINEEMPIWIFDKIDHFEERTIKGTEINKMIFIGEKVNTNNGIIYGDGILNKEDSIKIEGFSINPYELRFQYKDDHQVYDQLLLRMKCWGGIYETSGYESRAVVNFIGDLDGDSKDDILITFQLTYKCWNYGLFSTRYAQDGKMFKEMIVGYGSE
ncbi:MAG: hypothetical protein KDD49_07110 [Bacteroidetes bacterium]|nr:hypothetical protein [Bacteroidota bacterium]